MFQIGLISVFLKDYPLPYDSILICPTKDFLQQIFRVIKCFVRSVFVTENVECFCQKLHCFGFPLNCGDWYIHAFTS